ncbi:hypothetical protein COU18_02380 [Candidatus Kaiserbacteria bacterium CG10_big_fil_rev_8_21_14_0_10_51_14]|uniref:Pesticidal crystal protein Cry22Aa Ig-like domain-containing protein n=1 Tax=Candidatus Kaiserbacteria bacterium CG10_big_fil_rev_8_21_14_0_10_51_14 TaxID=1974610 RepID=A0A2H0UBM0_9BACT|nr:MAG: hypothetical protein COU18_02380 [Candidatus Kaiserbacteria bacterium CG10_big_fil_rev_8_21_14_0_10_51_14]
MAFLRFLQYHNAVPIAFSIMLLGAGGLYAATNPEAILSAEQTVISVDNTYVANKDFSSYTPSVRITDVTEDDDYYYVEYDFSTIDLLDYTWQDLVKNGQVMRVSKADLGPYRDLGLYVTRQLKQLVDRELARLKETQDIEKENIRHKVVATAYSGLVGAFLDDTTEEIAGYEPVVEPPAPAPQPIAQALQEDQVEEIPAEETPPALEEEAPSESSEEETPSSPAASSTPPEATSTPSGGGGTSGQGTSTPPTGDVTPPTLQVLGQNPARVPMGDAYTDLGAAATDNSNEDLDIVVYVNGTEVSSISIDTSTTGEWVVRYEATDSAGNTGSAERTVKVYDPALEQPTSGGEETSTSTPPQEEATTEETPPPPPAEETPAEAGAPEEPVSEESPPADSPPAEDSPPEESPPAEPPPPVEDPPTDTPPAE